MTSDVLGGIGPTMLSCVVYGCNNNTLTNSDPNLSYYYFPKQPDLAQQWIRASGWDKDHIDLETSRVCSIHFDENSYTTEYKVMDFITCYTKVLKYDAVPTLYLPATTQIVISHSLDCTDVSLENQLNSGQSDIKQMIVFVNTDQPTYEISLHKEDKCLSVDNSCKLSTQSFIISEQTCSNVTPGVKPLQLPNDTEHHEKYSPFQNEEQLMKLKSSNDVLRNRIKEMEETTNTNQQLMLEKQKEWKEKLDRYKRMRRKYLQLRQRLLIMKRQKAALPKVFSSSQIKILSGKKKIYWSNDDMAVGYTIRHLSNKRCYAYLTRNLKIPLPALSSIKRWVNQKFKSPIKPIKSEDETFSEND